VVADELVMDRFRLLERIGSGGMGVVYRAFDERLQRPVAVKEVTASEPDRVLREAQAAARLNHPGIVTLYELGELAGHALLVSELVPGETLARLRAEGSLSDREVGELAADLCDALAHAHARGVVHRDLKPENVIVRDDQGTGRRAKLMDFGIARIAGAPTLTAAGEVVGTLAYMSPEQAEGRVAGPPSDVYSLALTLYECWAGANPVAAATPAATARRIGMSVPSLRNFRPDLPEGLVAELDACLEPDPELRPTALELRECLEQELGDLADAPVPGAEESMPRADRGRLGAGRIAALSALAGVLVLVAGPLGAPGAGLVLAVLCAPALIAGAPAAALAGPVAPLLAAAGIPSAAAALGAPAPSRPAQALLGAGAWAWMLVAALTLGVGPDLGIADRAPDGWAADTAVAAETVLAPLVSLDSLLGLGVFAAASVLLGELLRLRHASVALLAAMLWAAGVNAALAIVGDGALGANAFGVVGAAAIAVAVEFGLLRGGGPAWARPRAANGSDPLTT
jgi:eukaryotic-like serine/threonine-protein kinase